MGSEIFICIQCKKECIDKWNNKNRKFCSCQCRQDSGVSVNTGKTQFKKGMKAWNTGINHWEGKIHPRPMLGRENKWGIHPPERRKRMSEIKKEQYKNGLMIWNYIDGRSHFVGPGRYGKDWGEIRMTIYKRDNFTCQFCGISMTELKIPFHVHHIIPFLTSFNNDESNLITLCPSCHRKEDARIIKILKGGDIYKNMKEKNE